MRKKYRNKFLVTLGPFYSTDRDTKQPKLVYEGCEDITQDAFSHEQAITTLLTKKGHRNLADEYLTALENIDNISENNLPDVKVVLQYKGKKIDMEGYPRLEEMRSLVVKKKNMTKSAVRNLRFGDLVLLYNDATDVPGLSDIFGKTKKRKNAENLQDDLFPDYNKSQQIMDYISR